MFWASLREASGGWTWASRREAGIVQAFVGNRTGRAAVKTKLKTPAKKESRIITFADGELRGEPTR